MKSLPKTNVKRPSCAGGEAAESVEDKNQRIVNLAMAGKRRLALADATHLAAGFMTKRAVARVLREQVEQLEKDLRALEKDLAERARLSGQLHEAARDTKDRVGCGTSQVVWMRSANLVAAVLCRHFPQNIYGLQSPAKESRE